MSWTAGSSLHSTLESSASSPIGMFDSGVGGLTVMHQMMHTLPNEHMIYFGDTARLPYGEKSPETIIRYSMENTAFLMDKGVKLIVVACSTASSLALKELQDVFNKPIIGTIDPGAASAIKQSKTGRIAVLGTKGTINSGAYMKAIHKIDPKAFVLPIACSLFVPLVEEHFADHLAARLIVEEYLRPIKDNQIDTIILGCTHYPLIKHLIADVVGPDVAIIDSASACAEVVKKCLNEYSLNRITTEESVYQYFVSDDPNKFKLLGKSFLTMPIEQVNLCSTQGAAPALSVTV